MKNDVLDIISGAIPLEKKFVVRFHKDDLSEHEFKELLSALRRDLRAERDKADNGTAEERNRHGYNAHCVMRLLETLNPKGITMQLATKATT